MKIIIEKGTSIENALKILSEFLTKNYSEYPIVKNTMNVYITLKNSDEQICPDNEKEYILSEFGNVKDVFAEERQLKFAKHLEYWNDFVKEHIRQQNRLENQIETDFAYLSSAKQKNRTEENIIKRTKQYDKSKFELKKLNDLINIICLLDTYIKNGNFNTYYIKRTGRSSYDYSLDVVFVFQGINGYDGYFDRRGLHDGFPSYL